MIITFDSQEGLGVGTLFFGENRAEGPVGACRLAG
jgi:hypothetical protein